MGVRRVVTGHDADGRSVIISDDDVEGVAFGERGGEGISIWGRDDTAHFPDDGSHPTWTALFPPVGGGRLTGVSLAPRGRGGCHNVHAPAPPRRPVAGAAGPPP